ncbi:esterase-like activity of phytase family protein [Sphingomonas sp.]|uniref:esterase-like activity of phytase family protein n=1 Tax=Sphingomonas sp. TaxID=28214 RepID=UPI002BA427C2|nr:esterase-like activity of phytase family protein [Sphingomonas sp.]HTG37949.1 esterase-like activity of phytase family protein [Sphingomonas sp.]
MRIAVSVLLCVLFVPSYSGAVRLDLPGDNRLLAKPVDLVPGQPARRQVGQLLYLGGIRLIERGTGTGGYSAIRVRGDRITLLNDGGNILDFRWRGGVALSEIRYSSLPAGPGSGWQKQDRDSESLAVDLATGRIWVGFERTNEIWQYDARFKRATARAAPSAMARWRENGGAESLVRMPDGGLVALSEGTRPRRGSRGRRAVYFADPSRGFDRGFAFTYYPPAGMQPTDAAVLPDGRLLVLNRAFELPLAFSNALSVVDRGAIRSGASVRGRVIARLAPPTLHDNFEGLAVTQEHGRTIIWLVSDDNQFALQQSLLLKFALIK